MNFCRNTSRSFLGTTGGNPYFMCQCNHVNTFWCIVFFLFGAKTPMLIFSGVPELYLQCQTICHEWTVGLVVGPSWSFGGSSVKNETAIGVQE